LKPGINFSRSCYADHTKVLTKTVVGQYNGDETYIVIKEGKYYLNLNVKRVQIKVLAGAI